MLALLFAANCTRGLDLTRHSTQSPASFHDNTLQKSRKQNMHCNIWQPALQKNAMPYTGLLLLLFCPQLSAGHHLPGVLALRLAADSTTGIWSSCRAVLTRAHATVMCDIAHGSCPITCHMLLTVS